MRRLITLKQLNDLTLIDLYSWLGGLKVTAQTWMREVPGSIPGPDKYFYVVCYVFVLI